MASGKLVGLTPSDFGLRRQVLCLNNLSRFHKLDVVVRAEAEIYLLEKELEKVTAGAWFFIPSGKNGRYPWDQAPIAAAAGGRDENYGDALEYTGFPMGWTFWFTDWLDRIAARKVLGPYEWKSG